MEGAGAVPGPPPPGGDLRRARQRPLRPVREPEAHTEEACVVAFSVGAPYPGFVEFFSEMLPEPHSTKQIEDCVGWALETSTEVMLAAADRCQPLARAERLAELTGAPLVTLRGAGHMIPARHPVKSNLLIKAFVDHLIQTEARMRVATTGQGGRGT